MTLIYPTDRADAKVLAQRLLAAAGKERHDEVRTTSDGPVGLAFEVPDDLADTVLGVQFVEPVDDPAPDGDGQPAAQAGGVFSDPPAGDAGGSASAEAEAGEPEVSVDADAGSSAVAAKAPRQRSTRSR